MTTNKTLSSATHLPFNILVLATMSAGKTSFINALIGEELLHAANEATTACITTLEQDEKRKLASACCHADNGELLEMAEDVQADRLKTWNRDHRVKNIVVRGNFNVHCSPAQGLVIHDTPGPNNSQDERHSKLMLEAIQKTPFDMVFYILNATQLGTHDDSQLLSMVKEELDLLQRPCKIVFILNKVDQLDPEKGESIASYVDLTADYLTGAGFADPVIVPLIANAALYASKELSGEFLSRKQRLELGSFKKACRQEPHILLKASRIPAIARESVKRHIQSITKNAFNGYRKDSALDLLMPYSGLTSVTILINQQRAVLEWKYIQNQAAAHKVSA